MEVILLLCPQIRCGYLVFGCGGMSKRTSVNASHSLLNRVICISLLPEVLHYTYWCSCFSKNQHEGSAAWLANVTKKFDMNRFFSLALACLHFSEVLLPVGMTTQGGIFQGLKWKQKPSWQFTLAHNPLEICQMHKNAGSILHLKGQVFSADGIRNSPLNEIGFFSESTEVSKTPLYWSQ